MAGRLQQLCPNDPDQWRALLESFAKVVFLDLGLAIDAYILSGYVDRSLAQEYRRIADVAERTLAEKAELEQAKADLTGMIVHDLKGPLGGILAVTQLALRDRSDDPRRRHFEHQFVLRVARIQIGKAGARLADQLKKLFP
jgi:signal transduction histidine kinase